MTDLSKIDVIGSEKHPPDASVKLNGPPGTGKTTQCAARLVEILNDGVSLSDVTWITYRTSLAMDTLRRLVEWDVIPEAELNNPHQGRTRHIATSHAVANRVLGGIGDIVESWQKNQFCQEELNVDFWGEGTESWEKTRGELWFDLHQFARKNLIPISEVHKTPQYRRFADEWPNHPPLADMADRWGEFKDRYDVYEFWEQLDRALQSDSRPPLRVFIVDEYHDAFPLLHELVTKWMENAETVIVAGDPLQVVNAYEGSDPKFYNNLDLPELLLPVSYRLGDRHWKLARDVLTNAHEPPEITIKDSGDDIEEFNPSQFVYNEYTESWDFPQADPGSPRWAVEKYGDDVLFLTRTRMQAAGVGAALRAAGVIYASQEGAGGWNLSKNKKQKMKLPLYNALQKLGWVDPSQFGGVRIGLDRFNDAGSGGKVPESIVLSSEEAAQILDHASAQTLSQSRGDTEDLIDKIREQEAPHTLAELSSHVEPEFWQLYTEGEASVGHLVRNMDDELCHTLTMALRRNDGPIREREMKTRVLTIHASKGSESNTVCLYDGISQRIGKEMRQDERMRKNEYRTWYVGLTRSSHNLLLVRDAFSWIHRIVPPPVAGV